MKISFCTQILNRWWQLQQVVEENLKALEGTPHEWVILDLGSDDGIELPEHPNLRYIRADRPAAYSIPRAKTQVLQLARGEYAFSLDADNYITATTIANILETPDIALWERVSGDPGTEGRIGAPVAAWEGIGYYPDWNGPARSDTEVAQRLGSTLDVRAIPTVEKAPIHNSIEQTVAHTSLSYAEWAALHYREIHKTAFVPTLDVALKAGAVQQGLMRTRVYDALAFSGELQYTVEFGIDFDYGKGGKLPGLAGGDIPLGGVKTYGFSARLAWDEVGRAFLYVYSPEKRGEGKYYPIPVQFRPGHVHSVRMYLKDGYIVCELNHRIIKVPVQHRRVSAVLYHVYRGGADLSWATKTDNVIKIRPGAN